MRDRIGAIVHRTVLVAGEKDAYAAADELIKAFPQLSSPPAGEGEPVAWRWRFDNDAPWSHGPAKPGKFRFGDPSEIEPLYAHPPSAGEEKTGEREAAERAARDIWVFFKTFGRAGEGAGETERWFDNHKQLGGPQWLINRLLALSPTSGGERE